MSDHNSTVSNYDNAGVRDGISIIVTSAPNKGITNDGEAHVTEIYYNAIKLRKADGKPLAEIIRSIEQALYSGEYNDTTGFAEIEEVNPLQLMTVYHGSGAAFDAFDHTHMGEGEGAQAYGWGTYVTEVEGIARSYGKEVSRKRSNITFDGIPLKQVFSNEFYWDETWRNWEKTLLKVRTADELKNNILNLYFFPKGKGIRERKKDFKEQQKRLLQAIDSGRIKVDATSMLYTVEIPEDNGSNYLHWEKSYSKNKFYQIKTKLIEELKEIYPKQSDEKIRYILNSSIELISNNLTGAGIYEIIQKNLSSPQAASQFLSEIGFVGISYPAQHTTGGRDDNARNYVIFNEADARITDHIQFLRTSRGEVYGFVKNGKIYLDASLLNPNTPIHEYTHLWDAALQKANSQLWQRGVELMKQTPLWDEIVGNPAYADIANDENLVASEVHARLTGKEGAALMEQWTNDATKEGTIFDHAAKISLIDRLRRWMREAWQWLKDTMVPWSTEEARTISLDDFIRMPIADLVSGKRLQRTEGDLYVVDAEFTDNTASTPVGETTTTDTSLEADQSAPSDLSAQSLIDTATELAAELGEEVEIITNPADVSWIPAEKRHTVKGAYNNGRIYIVPSNNTSIDDIRATVLHEIVGHKGMRGLLGSEAYDRFLADVYRMMHPEAPAGNLSAPALVEADEYVARLAESGTAEPSLWQRITNLVRRALRAVGIDVKLTDAEIRYMLYQSDSRLRRLARETNPITIARDIATNDRLSTQAYLSRGNESTRNQIERLFLSAINGDLTGKPISIGRLTSKGREYLQSISGITFKENVDFVLNPSDLKHIYNQHFGNNEKDTGNNIALTIDDIRNMVDVISNPQYIIPAVEEKTGRKMLYFLKDGKNGTFNLLEIYSDRKGNLTAKTYYKTKKTASQRAMSLINSLHSTPYDAIGASLYEAKVGNLFELPNSIPQNNPNYRANIDDYELKTAFERIVGVDRRVSNTKYLRGTTETGETWEIRIANHPANWVNIEEHVESLEDMPTYFTSIVVTNGFDRDRARFESSEQIQEEFDRRGINTTVDQVIYDTEDLPAYLYDEIIDNFTQSFDLFRRTGRSYFGIDQTTRYREEIDAVNDRFNKELQQQQDGTLPQGHIYQLGMPSEVLLSSGLPNLPIQMAASRLTNKSNQENHPFDLSEVGNLPQAIQHPLAVFRSATHIGSFVVMTEIEHNGRNFVVAIEANRKQGRIEVNSIRSIHPRTTTNILDWINNDLLEYADSKRVLEWLQEKIKSRSYLNSSNPADVKQQLDSATKIVQNFDNPSIEEQNNPSIASERLNMDNPTFTQLRGESGDGIIDQARAAADVIRFRELPTRDFSTAVDFNNVANQISAAMAAQDTEHTALGLRERAFDDKVRLDALLDTIKKAYGIDIPAELNPWIAENASRSTAQYRIRQFDEELADALIRRINECLANLAEKDGKTTKDLTRSHRDGWFGEKIYGATEYLNRLSTYVQAKAAVERQEVKSREAEAEAAEKGEEYHEREWAGRPGVQYAIIGLYGGIDDDVEKHKTNGKWLQDYAERTKIPTINGYIELIEKELGNNLTGELWAAIRAISEHNLAVALEAGILSRSGYQTLTYGMNIDAEINKIANEKLKELTEWLKQSPDDENILREIDDINRRRMIAITKVSMGDFEWLVNNGWLTKEQVDGFHRYYEYYVPLKGYAEATAEDVAEYSSKSMPNNTSGVRAVQGHTQLARDPFNQLLRDSRGALLAAEQNKWRQKLYTILSQHPLPEQYFIQQLYYQEVLLPDGSKEYRPYVQPIIAPNGSTIYIPAEPTEEQLASGEVFSFDQKAKVDIHITPAQRSEHNVTVYVAGKAVEIFFYDPRISRAINGQNIRRLPDKWYGRAIGQYQRTLAALKTSLNPAFALGSNIWRDSQEVISNAYINGGLLYMLRTARGILPVYGDTTLSRYLAGKLTADNAKTQREKYTIEYFANGGQVNITQLPSYEDTTKELKKEIISYLEHGNTRYDGNKFVQFLKKSGEEIELRSRLATYIASRQSGRTIEEAVNDAKEATTNFDRKGSWAAYGGFFQLFFNASMQAVRRQVNLWRHHPARAITTYAMIAALQPTVSILFSCLLGGDDDWRETIKKYFAINPAVRRRYHCYIIDGKIHRIPVAVNYLPFTTLGDTLAEWLLTDNILNRDSGKQKAIDIVGAFMDVTLPTFIAQPIQFALEGNTFAAWFSICDIPALEPLAQSIGNYNFMGTPLYPEPFDENSDKPYYLDTFSHTPYLYISLSEMLNRLSEGREGRAGWFNVHPEVLQNIMSLGGGYTEMAEQLITMGIKTATGEPIEQKDIPVISRFSAGDADERYQKRMRSLYYQDIRALNDYTENRRESAKADEVTEFVTEYQPDEHTYFADLATMQKVAKKIEKHITGDAEQDKPYTDALQALYETANRQAISIATDEEYKPVEEQYYQIMRIIDTIDKQYYQAADGRYRTLDETIDAWNAANPRRNPKEQFYGRNRATELYSLQQDLRELQKIYRKIDTHYYPGTPAENTIDGRRLMRQADQLARRIINRYGRVDIAAIIQNTQVQ